MKKDMPQQLIVCEHHTVGVRKLGLAIFASLAMLMSPHLANGQNFSDEDGIWTYVCSGQGAYYMNIMTGQRRDPEERPNGPSNKGACHNGLCRRTVLSLQV